MPVEVQCENFPLLADEVGSIWQEVLRTQEHKDDEVTISCVSEEEVRRLNREYRQVDKATNVLTFSYGEGEHDVSLCLAVAEREAKRQSKPVRDYIALLLAHAFLHVAGLDHEESEQAARDMRAKEKLITAAAGFGEGISLG